MTKALSSKVSKHTPLYFHESVKRESHRKNQLRTNKDNINRYWAALDTLATERLENATSADAVLLSLYQSYSAACSALSALQV